MTLCSWNATLVKVRRSSSLGLYRKWVNTDCQKFRRRALQLRRLLLLIRSVHLFRNPLLAHSFALNYHWLAQSGMRSPYKFIQYKRLRSLLRTRSFLYFWTPQTYNQSSFSLTFIKLVSCCEFKLTCFTFAWIIFHGLRHSIDGRVGWFPEWGLLCCFCPFVLSLVSQ